MYGYVVPSYPELRMRDYTLYRAYYCGLCRAMGDVTGEVSRLTLSYDLTFLAIVRSCMLGEAVTVAPSRCLIHPTKKRPVAAVTPSMEFAACASAVLSRAKLDDTKHDERGAKRAAASVLTPAATRMMRRAESVCPGLYGTLCDDLSVLASLENDRSDSVDDAACAFGQSLSHILAYGTDGGLSRIASEIGSLVGRFVYVIDAADDAASDAKSGSYNPLVLAYGKDLTERRTVYDKRGKAAEKDVLRRDIADGIMTACDIMLARLNASCELLDLDSHPAGMLIRNIVTLGMPGEMKRVLGLLEKPSDIVTTERTV